MSQKKIYSASVFATVMTVFMLQACGDDGDNNKDGDDTETSDGDDTETSDGDDTETSDGGDGGDAGSANDSDSDSDSGGGGATWEPGPYAMLSIVGDSSFFLGVMESLDVGTYTLDASYEEWGQFVFCSGDKVFVTSDPSMGGSGNEMEVYSLGNDNTLTKEGTLVTDDGTTITDILYLNEEEAYVTLQYVGKVLKINPTTLKQTAEIDLSNLAIGGDDSEEIDNSPEPSDMVVKDGKLYVTLNQSYYGLYMGRPGMHVAVIDMDTNTVEKTIDDVDRGYAFAGRTGGTGTTSFLDENGHLYINSTASWGYEPSQKPGLLRIKAGEEVFDPDWEFDLSEKTVTVDGEEMSVDHLLSIAYAGDGIAYAVGNIPALFSEKVDWIHDRTVAVLKLDLYNDTVEPLPVPRTSQYSADLRLDGDLLILPMYTDAGFGVYVYDTTTGDVVKEPTVALDAATFRFCVFE
jgi:hypothetical protein